MESRIHFMLRWTGSTGLGCTAGIVALFASLLGAGTIVSWIYPAPLGRIDAAYLIFLCGGCFVAGSALGFAQWEAVLRRQGRKYNWIGICAIAGVTAFLGLVIFVPTAPFPYRMFVDIKGASGLEAWIGDELVISSTWFLSAVRTGAILGASYSLPHWFVLRRHFHRASHWIIGSIAAGIIAYCLQVIFSYSAEALPASLCFTLCVMPFIFQAAAGFALYGVLRHPKLAKSA